MNLLHNVLLIIHSFEDQSLRNRMTNFVLSLAEFRELFLVYLTVIKCTSYASLGMPMACVSLRIDWKWADFFLSQLLSRSSTPLLDENRSK